MSPRVAAGAIGISAGFLSRLERGQRAPRTATAVRRVRALDLDDDVAEDLLDAAVERTWPV
ncbi:MAG: helix-turn-helix transcriptional regulator [Deltaproteobacteria bacterium]|nr:helix-turn-helix transcriptional regulator [Deltaproteobacteria bacterium]